MLHEKAVKKVEKALGVKVELIGNCRYGVTYNGYVLSWLVQRQWKVENDKIMKDGPLEAHNWHARRVNDHSDPMTDYFAGSHFDNITQLIHWVKPPAPTFKVGDLVKGKDNKRAQRRGYAGRLAIVEEINGSTGKYFYPKWVDGKQDTYRFEYPERDFARV